MERGTGEVETEAFVETLPFDELEDGFLEPAVVGDINIVVGRVGDAAFAFDENCTHQECSFADGEIDDSALACPCHGAEFDPRSGAVLMGPATEPVRVFETRIVDGTVLVRHPDR